MKMLMVLNDMAWFWSHRLPLAQAIIHRGWKLDIAAAGAAEDARLRDFDIGGRDIPDATDLFSHIRIIRALGRGIVESNPDIIHALTLRHAFYTGIALRLTGRQIPAVFTIAGLGSLFSTPTWLLRLLRPFLIRVMRWAFARPHIRLIFQNDDNRRAFLHFIIIAANQAILIRGSGVDIHQFTPVPESQSERPVILYAGRLLKDKGVGEFIEAARLLRAKNSPARFVMAGDFYPKNPHSLDPDLVRTWVEEGIVEWIGQSHEMSAVIQSAALAVLPSYHEGLPKFLLEAAASGRAIITTNIPGCRDVVRDGYNGLLVPPRDAQALADAIEYLVNNPEQRRVMGHHGRQLAEVEFAVEKVVSQTSEVYDRLLGERA